MRRSVTALAIAAALALAGPAQAHGRHHHHHHHHRIVVRPAPPVALTLAALLPLAQDAAVEYWGGVPCGGSVTIVYAPQAAAPADQTDGVSPSTPLWAWVTFDTPAGPSDWSQPPSAFTSCVVYLNEDILTPAAQAFDFPDFCGLIVHEYGHFFGHPDLAADSPTSITYPYIGALNEGVGPCVSRYDLVS